MNDLTFQQLRNANQQRRVEFGHGTLEWTDTDLGCAIAGETGEMCNLLKKMRRGENIPLKDVGEEMADVVIYIDILANKMGINLGDVVRKKFNKVSRRRKLGTKL